MEQLKALLTQNRIPYREQEPLSNHTTFKIGGPCPLYVLPENREQLSVLLNALRKMHQEFLVIGNGSNLLVSDQGTQMVVIRLSGEFAQIQPVENKLIAGGGAQLAALCKKAAELSLTGLEFAYGIPGSIGGAVYMNAGAYGGEMKDVLEYVQVMDLRGNIRELTLEDLQMGYRTSALQHQTGVLIQAVFCLSPGNREEIQAKMEDILGRRKEKQPLEYPSAGSTFKRPQGAYAAALIEECGLKGQRVGGAMVSPKHSGFLINYDHATCKDVEELIALVQKTVRIQTGFSLECEVKKID